MTGIKNINETSSVSLNDGVANERSFIFFPLLFFLEVMENEKCSVRVKIMIKNESYG